LKQRAADDNGSGAPDEVRVKMVFSGAGIASPGMSKEGWVSMSEVESMVKTWREQWVQEDEETMKGLI
jgi:hypothetical protein